METQSIPDYRGGSIVNLMASVGAAIGAPDNGYVVLDRLSPQRLARHRNLVLLLIDGLGYEFLTQRHRNSVLGSHLEGSLTSVFPPTTASAVTTFFTGVAPQQHAITGWFTYLKEAGSVATILPFHPRHGGTSYRAQGISPRQIIGHGSLLGHPGLRPCHVVTADYLVDSEYSVATGGTATRHGYRDLDGLFRAVRRLVTGSSSPGFVFAYWPKLDGLAHRYGISSDEVGAHFATLDHAFAAFLDRIRGTDTLVIVVADHGLVDTSPERTIRLDGHPELARLLTVPLCGEPRAAYCYVRADGAEAFETYVRGKLDHACEVRRSADLVTEGWFGEGPAHPRLADRIGDFVLLMKEDYTIKDRVLGESPSTQIGVHGGLTEAELLVPLVVVEA